MCPNPQERLAKRNRGIVSTSQPHPSLAELVTPSPKGKVKTYLPLWGRWILRSKRRMRLRCVNVSPLHFVCEVAVPATGSSHKKLRASFKVYCLAWRDRVAVIRTQSRFAYARGVCSTVRVQYKSRPSTDGLHPQREFAPSCKLPTGKDGAMFRIPLAVSCHTSTYRCG